MADAVRIVFFTVVCVPNMTHKKIIMSFLLYIKCAIMKL